MKASLKSVTLICADTTNKWQSSLRAVQRSTEQCDFGAVKLLTDQIPQLVGLEAYSNFCIRDMAAHVQTSHALVVQSDGYVLNGGAWTDEFLSYDYIGAPWLPSRAVGNGGFSLRSKKLLDILASHPFGDSPHPEDNYICLRHRRQLEAMGIKFAPYEVAQLFAFEGRSWNNGVEWSGVPTHYHGQFGFHSWLTPMPGNIPHPKIFHHTGDWGDVIYSLPVIKALGGGVLFLSDDNRFPIPRPSRERVSAQWVNNLSPLLCAQEYIERVAYTHGLPFSTDYDLNKFRKLWSAPSVDITTSIFHMHLKTFGLSHPQDEPWLKVEGPIIVPGRPIVINRTARYRNFHFPIAHLVRTYAQEMVFVGSRKEYEDFKALPDSMNKKVPWLPTADLLELARVIEGSRVFIGNQSAPMAIAIGLGKNIFQEVWQGNPNCLFARNNAIYWGVNNTEDYPTLPKEWLCPE